MQFGILYICPTPIGNLEDITLRTLRILEEVDLIACEDTRHSLRLLNHYEIKKPLTAYHEHNIKQKGPDLIQSLKDGKSIALISDAGMPGISDPGQDIIRLAIEGDIEVVVLPGPTASITALVASGLSTDKFIFEGFLPSKKRDRVKVLEDLKKEKRTIIFYEAPHRVKECLGDMLKVLGNRRLAIGRELTKHFEEIFRGTIEDAILRYLEGTVKGEFVIIVEGSTLEEVVDIDIVQELRKYIEGGLSKKEAVKQVAGQYKLPKNEVYAESLKI